MRGGEMAVAAKGPEQSRREGRGVRR